LKIKDLKMNNVTANERFNLAKDECYLKPDPACALPVEASLIDRVRKYIMNIVNVMYAILVDPLSTYSI
jgi:hypothetical protein